MNLPNEIDKSTAAFLQLSPLIGPDDPRRDTVNGHAEHAKSQVQNYHCYPDDYSSGRKPKPGDSTGKDTGFGNAIRAPSKKNTPPTKGGKEGKTSKIKQECVEDLMTSTQVQV